LLGRIGLPVLVVKEARDHLLPWKKTLSCGRNYGLAKLQGK
jgi:hypothetical protein